jgi:hypothetical protein
MNGSPFDQTAAAQPGYSDRISGGGLAGGGPAGEWLREAAPGWAAPAGQWPRYDLAEPARPRLQLTGAAPWLAAGLLCAFLIVNRSPAPPPAAVPTPVAAGLPSPAACGPVAP